MLTFEINSLNAHIELLNGMIESADASEDEQGAEMLHNYAVRRPYGGGILGTPRRYQLSCGEHEAIETISEAACEFPALRALAAWAEANGAPGALLEAWESSKHGAQWAVEGRAQPDDWKPYRT